MMPNPIHSSCHGPDAGYMAWNLRTCREEVVRWHDAHDLLPSELVRRIQLKQRFD